MRNNEEMQRLITHEGRVRGNTWPATNDVEEIKRRIDMLLLEGETATEKHREMRDYRRTL